MSKFKTLFRLTAATLALAMAALPALAQGPGLGQKATPDQIAAVDISIPPDGQNLPPGNGTVAMGKALFGEQCASCHGEAGAGGKGGLVQLTGGIGTLASPQPVKTINSYWPYATTIFDYIRRAMPVTHPQSLTNEQVYAVTAYLLSVDGIVPEGTTLDAKTLPAVQMPNRDGFANWYGKPPTP
ncbi:MAG TPA: cytochrome c [Devosiaceae bacterium]|jgi:cytochrome c